MGKKNREAKSPKAAPDTSAEDIIKIVKYGGAVLAALGAMALLNAMTPGGEVVQLSVDNADQLKEALFGGQPWLISCYADGDLHSTELKQASVRLKEAGITTAVIDCNAKLPSGKTVWRRMGFKAKPEDLKAGKRSFFVGNGRKASELDSSQAMTENNYVRFATRLADLWVHLPRTALELEKVCFKKKACAMITTRGKPMGNELKAIREVSKRHRTMPIVLIDIEKKNFTGYPGPVPELGGGNPKLAMFLQPPATNADGTADFATGFKPYKRSMGNVEKIDKWVTGLLEASFEDAGVETLKLLPTIIPPPPKKRKRSNRSPEEIAELKKQQKKNRLAREQARREKMDEEMGSLIEDDEDADPALDEMDMEELDEGDVEEIDEDEGEAEEIEEEEVE